MTKKQEEELIRDVSNLKRQLHKLLLKAENNQLEKIEMAIKYGVA